MKVADITPGKKYVYKFRNMITYRPDYREVRVLMTNVPVKSYPANLDERSKLSQGGVLVEETGNTDRNRWAEKGRITIVQPQHILYEVAKSRAVKLDNVPERVETNGREYEIWYRVEKNDWAYDARGQYRKMWIDAGGPVRDFRLPSREMAVSFIEGRHDITAEPKYCRIVPVRVRVKAADRTRVNA